MTDRQVIHRLPAGQGPQVNSTLARLFGAELVDALAERRAQRAGVEPARREAKDFSTKQPRTLI